MRSWSDGVSLERQQLLLHHVRRPGPRRSQDLPTPMGQSLAAAAFSTRLQRAVGALSIPPPWPVCVHASRARQTILARSSTAITCRGGLAETGRRAPFRSHRARGRVSFSPWPFSRPRVSEQEASRGEATQTAAAAGWEKSSSSIQERPNHTV